MLNASNVTAVMCQVTFVKILVYLYLDVFM